MRCIDHQFLGENAFGGIGCLIDQCFDQIVPLVLFACCFNVPFLQVTCGNVFLKETCQKTMLKDRSLKITFPLRNHPVF